MATFLDLYARVNTYVMDSDTAAAKNHVNDVYREIVGDLGLLPVSVTKTMVAGQTTYSLVTDWSITDLARIESISYAPAGAGGGGQAWILEPVTLEEIIGIRSALGSGFTRQYALRGLDKLEVYPSSSNVGDQLNIYYWGYPVVLSADVDVPVSVPSEFHQVLAYGAAARHANVESSFLGDVFKAKYDEAYVSLRQYLNRRPGRIPKRARSGYAQHFPLVPHDRSTYYTGSD